MEKLTYSPKQENKVRQWMEAVTGEEIPKGSFWEALMDGVYLCKMINKVQLGSVKRINTNDNSPSYRQMENIGNFILACEDYGLTQENLFEPIDLHSGQNIPQVINTLQALARKCQENGVSILQF